MEEPGRHQLNHVIKANGASKKSVVITRLPERDKGASPCGLLPKPAALPGHEQTIVQAPAEEQSNKTLNSSKLARS